MPTDAVNYCNDSDRGAPAETPRLLEELLRAYRGVQYEMVARAALVDRGMLTGKMIGVGKPELTSDGRELAEMLISIGERAL